MSGREDPSADTTRSPLHYLNHGTILEYDTSLIDDSVSPPVALGAGAAGRHMQQKQQKQQKQQRHTVSKAEVILHPTRLRLIHAFGAGRRLTAPPLAAPLPGLPQRSL